jgi:tetratricopeptide (TPR) repeat protein
LLEISRTEAHKKLYQSEYQAAIPAALQALRCSMDLFGQDSINIVPSYLLLGEASIGLKEYNQAEEYLSLAKWAIIKSKVVGEYEIEAQLHHNFGLLYLANKNFKEASLHIAQEVRDVFVK